jgi:hypothetical protein
MNNYSLISSVQAGPFGPANSNRMIDIDIPENHMCDLTQSFIQLECSATVPAELAGNVVNMCLSNGAEASYTPMNVDLIKNCSLTSQMKGQLENIRRVNVLSHNLKELTKSTTEKLSMIDTIFQTPAYDSQILLSPFVEFHKVGDVPSRMINCFLRIPLSDLFQLAGAVSAFDTSKLGKCRIHLELDNMANYVMYQQLTTSISNMPVFVPCDDITSGNVIVVTGAYKTLDLSPWYVGQVINVLGTAPGGTEGVLKAGAIITSIAYAEDTGIISISIDQTFVAGASDYTTITIGEVLAEEATGVFSILTASLGLATADGLNVQSPNELSYLTFTTEEYSTGTSSFMNRVFDLEPECVNTFMLFNNNYDGSSVPNLVSNNVNISSYRLRLDNVDIIDRDVFVNKQGVSNMYTHDALHYDLINKTFLNANLPLKNLTCLNLGRDKTALNDKFSVDVNQILMICTPTPMTSMPKKYQVNLDTKPGNVGNVILYKQVVKTLKM